jgi:predicted nucleic acid-binding protein
MPRDNRHAAASALATRYASSMLVTSNHVRGETWTLLRRRAGHEVAIAFLDRVDDSPRASVIHVGVEIENEAVAWLRRHDERAYSFIDATSFALMRSLGIHEALAFDDDFAAAGFVPLRAD